MMVQKRLESKIAFVTGAASGIGAAIAKLFVEQGARVVAADRNDEAGYALVEELNQTAKREEQPDNKHASFVHLEVTSEEEWIHAMQKVKEAYGGRLDVMVNCAGLFNSSPSISETKLEDFQKIINVNVQGTFLGIKHASDLMKQIKDPTPDGGVIINMASVAGKISVAQMTSYCASKAAVQHMTKVAALDLARHSPSIRCTSICPIWVRTNMFDAVEKDFGEIKDADANPMGAVLEPQDVAFTALFLASPEAKFITGTEIVIDGGFTAQ